MDKDLKKNEAMSVIDLGSIQKIFDKINIKSEVMAASGAMPLSTLVAYISKDKKNRDIIFSFTFIPLPSNVFPDVKLLQWYTELPFDPKKDLSALLTSINTTLPMGSFGISETKKVYYRYVHTIGKYENLLDSQDVHLNILNIILYVLNINSEAIEQGS